MFKQVLVLTVFATLASCAHNEKRTPSSAQGECKDGPIKYCVGDTVMYFNNWKPKNYTNADYGMYTNLPHYAVIQAFDSNTPNTLLIKDVDTNELSKELTTQVFSTDTNTCAESAKGEKFCVGMTYENILGVTEEVIGAHLDHSDSAGFKMHFAVKVSQNGENKLNQRLTADELSYRSKKNVFEVNNVVRKSKYSFGISGKKTPGKEDISKRVAEVSSFISRRDNTGAFEKGCREKLNAPHVEFKVLNAVIDESSCEVGKYVKGKEKFHIPGPGDGPDYYAPDWKGHDVTCNIEYTYNCNFDIYFRFQNYKEN